jgi:hypothetical protein
MRARFIGGVFCLVLAAAFVHGGGSGKEPPYEEASFDEVRALLGDWVATIDTKAGWHGTLHGHVTAQRTGPEGALFHAFIELRYDLTWHDKKKPAVTSGNERIALIPFEKGRARYLQCMRDFQVMQREQAEEVLEFRPDDKEALKYRAAFRPSKQNTALYKIGTNTWILTASPGLLAMLPRQAPNGPAIDWNDEIAWKRVKKK